MAKRYYFKDGDSIELSSNSVFSTGDMPVEHESSIVYIAAYDSNGDIITPTAGTATVSVESIEGEFDSGTSDGDNPIDLTLTGASASYSKPLFLGCVQSAKMSISGVDFGAVDHIKAFMWRA